ASGYANFGWINTTSGNAGTTAPDRIYASSDAYIRYYSPANFKTVLNLVDKSAGTVNYIPKWTPDGDTLGNSLIYDNGTNVGIGTTGPTEKLEVVGKIKLDDETMEATSVTFDGDTSAGLKLTNPRGYITFTPLNTGWAHVYTDRPNFIFNKPVWSIDDAFSSYDADLKLQRAGTTKLTLGASSASFADTSITAGGNVVWHAGNDGSGSGLDADLLDGLSSASFDQSNTNEIQTLGTSGNTITLTSGGSVTAPYANSAGTISNTGYVTLGSSIESNSIYITQPSYTTNLPVKLLNFDWYNNVWSIGNIRSGSTPSMGLGIYFTESGGSISEKMRISSSGNVGIGTTAPGNKLELATHTAAAGGIGFGTDVDLYRSAANTLALASGDSFNLVSGNLQVAGTSVITSGRLILGANGTAAAPAFSFSADTNNGMFRATTDALGFSTAGTERIRIAANGNVGIGTTGPETTLSVQNTGYRQISIRGGGTGHQTLNLGSVESSVGSYVYNNAYYYSSNTYRPSQTVASGIQMRNDGSIDLLTDTGLTIGTTYTPTSRIKITGTGNVGIGTTAPGNKLELATHTAAAGGIGFGTDVDLYRSAANTLALASGDSLNLVSGNLQVAGTSVITSGRLVLGANGTAAAPAFSFSADTNNGMFRATTDALGFSTAGTERIRIAANGNVGIGTTSPTTQTEIQRVETVNRTTYNDILAVTANATTMPYSGHGGGIVFKGTTYRSGVGNVNYARIGSTLNDHSGTTAGSDLFFDVSPLDDGVLSRAMTIKYSGNVGIGTTAPTAKLYVNDSSASQDGLNVYKASASGYTALKVRHESNSTSSVVADFQNSLGSVMYVRADGNVGIGTNSPGHKLTVNGGDIYGSNNLILAGGLSDSEGKRITNPGGGSYVTSASTVTGAWKIKLPTAKHNSSTMLRFTVKIYEYSTGKSRTIEVGGYNYSSGSWYNPFAYQTSDTGGNLNIRYGDDGSSDVVWIGDTNSTWTYPQVYITDVQLGYSSYSSVWASGWSITPVTSFDTVEAGPYVISRSWNQNNDGAGSGLDADLLDGLHIHTGRNNEANKVVRTDGSGYIQAGWINTDSGSAGTTAPTRIYGSYDGYLRYYTPANFATVMKSDILTALKTVDGAGSGLDADLLDGLHKTSFGASLDTSGNTIRLKNSDATVLSTITAPYATSAGNADTVDFLHAASFLRSDAADVWNDAGSAIDLRFEGDTDQNLLFLDGSADNVGIGTSTPGAKLEVVGSSAGSETAEVVVVYDTPGTYSFTVPTGVTSLKVEAWGGGGNGGEGYFFEPCGGGGGAYAANPSISVTPGASYSVRVGSSGSDSYFRNTSTLRAAGGSTEAPGTASSSVGTVKYSGGSPTCGSGLYSSAGAGGGSAGPHGAGGNASGGTGGVGDAGYGGAGGNPNGGSNPLGGGGAGVAGKYEGYAGSPGGGGAALDYSTSNGAPGQVVITYSTTPATPIFKVKDGSTEVFRVSNYVGILNTNPSVALDVTGSIEYTGTITDVSDIRLKENIVEVTGVNALSIVSSLQAKSFNMKDTGDKEYGYIAQEVKEIFPDAVSIVDPENGYMGINYMAFIPLATEAVKELNLNLNAISGTIIPVVGSSAETFANNFFANMFTKIGTWLADAANGLEKIFVREVRTQKLCIINDLGEETCVEREGLKNLLDGAVFAETEGGGETGTEQEGEELPPPEELPPEEETAEETTEEETTGETDTTDTTDTADTTDTTNTTDTTDTSGTTDTTDTTDTTTEQEGEELPPPEEVPPKTEPSEETTDTTETTDTPEPIPTTESELTPETDPESEPEPTPDTEPEPEPDPTPTENPPPDETDPTPDP
ncbi:MAG: tail fiber domain-containing protein, partial [Fibrobacter sp.]|nr:tail fiber domain-containing protein [Fibrobacter sp.]